MLRPFTKHRTANVRAGVMQDGDHFELAMVRRLKEGGLGLAACNVDLKGGPDAWLPRAAEGLGNADLPKARVSVVLGADVYSLQLIEAPNVADDEMSEAVRWRIQHLIEYPIGEAAIDILEMPAHSNPGNKPMLCAVVTHRDEILRQIERMQAADLKLDVIDIPELCLRNVAVLLPQDFDGVAFLHFTDDCGYLTITRQGVLYMIRRIEISKRDLSGGGDEFSLQERSAGVALEVQRSLDYYESHYDCRPVTELVLGPGKDLDTLATSLSENLGISVTRFALEDVFRMENEMPEDVQSDCLLAVGAALRSDHIGREARR